MSKTKKAPVGMSWSSPPDDKPDWAAVASALRTRPNEWLRVYVHGRESWANAMSRGRIRALRPDLGFEFRTTDNTRDYPRTCTLYARFNPDRVDPLTDLLDDREKEV
jgi:hypothetical protein